MKRINISSLLFVLLCGTLIQSCKTETTSPPQEFVADNATFATATTWPTTATRKGPDPALGDMAHGGQDTSVTRVVRIKDNQNRVSEKFPLGTVIVKYSTSPKGLNVTTAMVKRGNNFSAATNDWEFFMLAPTGTIATDPATGATMRGANLMDGMCAGCHSHASKDFVFTR